MDSHDGWRLRPVAEPVSYFDARTGQWTSGSFETAVKSEKRPALQMGAVRTAAASARKSLSEASKRASGLMQPSPRPSAISR